MTETCKHCTINLVNKKGQLIPEIFPCGINRKKGINGWKEESFICPWETKEQQDAMVIVRDHEVFAGFLGGKSGSGFDDV